MSLLIVLIVFLCMYVLIFEFINGFHDTANAVATVIYTRSMKPRLAVMRSWLWMSMSRIEYRETIASWRTYPYYNYLQDRIFLSIIIVVYYLEYLHVAQVTTLFEYACTYWLYYWNHIRVRANTSA
jgi:hypothetical protein